MWHWVIALTHALHLIFIKNWTELHAYYVVVEIFNGSDTLSFSFWAALFPVLQHLIAEPPNNIQCQLTWSAEASDLVFLLRGVSFSLPLLLFLLTQFFFFLRCLKGNLTLCNPFFILFLVNFHLMFVIDLFFLGESNRLVFWRVP